MPQLDILCSWVSVLVQLVTSDLKSGTDPFWSLWKAVNTLVQHMSIMECWIYSGADLEGRYDLAFVSPES